MSTPQLGHLEHTRVQQVISDALKTYKVCQETAAYCIKKGGAFLDLEMLQLLYHTADINLALANFLTRGTRFYRELAGLASKVSLACAESMAHLEHDDPQLRTAYAVCQRACHACNELLGKEDRVETDAQDQAVWESFPASDPPPPPSMAGSTGEAGGTGAS